MAYLSPEQCRAARALLDWQQMDLFTRSRVSKKTIADFERGKTTPWPRTLEDLRRTFEAAGVVFLDDGEEGGVGVRMKAGAKAVTRTGQSEVRSDEGGASGLSSMGWDQDDASDLPAHERPLPSHVIEDRAFWAARRDAWERLSPAGRKVLSEKLGIASREG